jgi:hypothetical protein
MIELAHELISLVEKYEKEEEYDFHDHGPDQMEIGRIMRTCIREAGYINRDSDVLYFLTMALVDRDVSPWTYHSIARFCRDFQNIYSGERYYHRIARFGRDFQNFYSGERYNLDAAIGQVLDMKIKIQLCAKRFLARKILAELKLRKLTLAQLRVKSSISMLTMDLLRKIVKIRLH